MKSKTKEAKNFFYERINSFKYAFDGLVFVLKTQKNAWIHLLVTIIVISISLYIGISAHEWIVILLVIGLVWLAEFLNTALEIIVDLASPEKHPLAKIGKDVGAASVLIAAILSIIIGLIILLPKILIRF